MKKNIINCSIIIILFFCFITVVFSENIPSITYDGKSNKFTCDNISNDDLFNNFKDLMPGDSRIQEINLKIKNIDKETSVYLVMKNDFEILNKIDFVVIDGDKVLYNSKTDSYTKQIKLKEFKTDGVLNLKVNIYVSTKIGNEMEDKKNKLNWTFLIDNGEDIIQLENPKTVDNVIYYVFAFFISFAFIAALVYLILKKYKK